ncbi:MAG: hypothetical protein M1830_000641 [Pleopsidium flavum]|nr:MAG: hypothetical protein M1830_000641 [Pleopsidium flavum]
MPVHPSEEEAPSGIFDQIAKNPSSATESTASDHALHQDDHSGGGKATPQDLQSKGPAIPKNMNDMPPKASKEELKARAEELNK